MCRAERQGRGLRRRRGGSLSARRGLLLAALLVFVAGPAAAAIDNATCLECHADKSLQAERGGMTLSLYVDKAVFSKSVHKSLDCVACHTEADVAELPHPERMKAVTCGACHDEEQVDFDTGIHGQALARHEIYAPNCKDCHGTHDILPPSVPESPTYKMNIPLMCGGCHREGAPVARVYDISEKNILENYSQSIHGVGLFKKGLTVTAACADCHGNHMILPHTDPRSTVAPRNIAATCTRCHARIEQVHVKVIRGELWEKAPGSIPACTDCHLAHKVRKESMALTISDRDCMKCHEKADVHKMVDGKNVSLVIDKDMIGGSMHRNIPCVKCHSDIDPRLRRPCETAARVECANCHAKIAEEYFQSGHGRAFVAKRQDVPYCTTCHGSHDVKAHGDESAAVYRASIPALCGKCHRTGGAASQIAGLLENSALADYSTSVHGRGLTEKGLLPSAVCTDCHNTHLILKHSENRASIYTKNIPATCATCHRGIYKQYVKSVHFSADNDTKKKLPSCTDCHSAHSITEVGRDKFMAEVSGQCGSCHKQLAQSYLQTMHGKAYTLGYLKVAKCSDCHGAHQILAVNDPNSSVGFNNIVTTCKKCHPDANRRFTGYLTHATHHDPVRYPILHHTYWAMTFLLVGVFGFFGAHTLLWLPRSFRHLRERRHNGDASPHPRYYIRRFTRPQRITHLFVIVSFMSLALTGMMLKFSSMRWAESLANLLGGVRVAGTIHRFAAVMTFGYFAFHIYSLVKAKTSRRVGWLQFIFDKSSLMFNQRDWSDFVATLKWFFGRGPRPAYGRWTYWEKFDYFAVFWGVAVIGCSGLMLWFPEFFTHVLPGSLINVATIIHSDEALLAVGFIFTIHFFNTHLRPEAFPMDKVIFTGVVPLDEYRADRPLDYEQLKASGELRRRVQMTRISRRRRRAVYAFGFTFLALGVVLIGLIIDSVLFGYK